MRVYTDGERTLQDIQAIEYSDVEGWKELDCVFIAASPRNFFHCFIPNYRRERCGGEPRELPLGAGAMRSVSPILTRQTSCNFASDFFQSAEMRGVIESWGYHLDFGPNVRGGATFAFVAAMSAHINGMPIVQGGAGRISEALRTMVETAGGRVMTATQVDQIVVKGGRATARFIRTLARRCLRAMP